MKSTHILVTATVLTLMASALPANALELLPSQEDEPARFIIGMHGYPDYEPGQSFHGEKVLDVDNPLKFVLVEVKNAEKFRESVMSDERVRYVELDDPDYGFLHFVPNDEFYNHSGHYGSKIIGGEAAWDVTLGSTAVKVAMVDSGLNKGHEEYAGQSRVLQGHDFVNDDTNPEDTSGCSFHGTHTTGTAGATINNGLGIAGMSQHTILPAKIFHASGGGPFACGTTTTAIVNALKYGADQGAHVSSNSWGGGSFSTAIDDAITYAHDRGVTHVASAGNSGSCSNCVGNPWLAAPERSIIVSASDANDDFASFSSQGPQVDIIAPGDSIASSTSGTGDYHLLSGTSMSAPHVAGSLALVKAVNSGFGYAELENAIKSTAVDLGLSSDRQGAGRLDVAAAIGGGGGEPPTNNPPSASFTESCTDLACGFTDTSTDGDGTIASWSWAFGDGGTSTAQNPSHTYATGGTYTVSLTVTDDDGATASTSHDVTVSEGGGGGGINLSATGYKVQGRHHIDLTWSGATSTNVDVYRNGAVVATTANDGFYTDATGNRGGATYTHKVCEAGTSTCSNEVTTVI